MIGYFIEMFFQMKFPYFLPAAFIFFFPLTLEQFQAPEQDMKSFAVIAYYSGNAGEIDQFPIEKLTHIIFSFGHLKGNRLSIRLLVKAK